MKCCRYTDGTCSREVEEDWEATGQEEMNRIYEQCKQNTSNMNVKETRKSNTVELRDKLNNLSELIKLCVYGLNESKCNQTKFVVSNILYFYILKEIQAAEEELTYL